MTLGVSDRVSVCNPGWLRIALHCLCRLEYSHGCTLPDPDTCRISYQVRVRLVGLCLLNPLENVKK